MFPAIQILVFLSLGVYLVRWRASARRRNRQNWDALLARLRPDWTAHTLSERFLWKEELDATPEDTWLRMEGAKGLWAMYQNARVMMEIADFAARNNPKVDRQALESLRSDAMQIRLCAMMGLAQYGFSQAGDGVRTNAYRAASIYASMAARLTQLLQEHAASIVPDFVAAM